eukprot:8982834-Pyramimonas_sp.AAC.1
MLEKNDNSKEVCGKEKESIQPGMGTTYYAVVLSCPKHRIYGRSIVLSASTYDSREPPQHCNPKRKRYVTFDGAAPGIPDLCRGSPDICRGSRGAVYTGRSFIVPKKPYIRPFIKAFLPESPTQDPTDAREERQQQRGAWQREG